MFHLLTRALVKILGQHHRRGTILGEPSVARVAHDGEGPGARAAPAEGSNTLEGSERRLLHDVLCVGAVPCDPSGEPAGIVEVGHEQLDETAWVGVVVDIQVDRMPPAPVYRHRTDLRSKDGAGA